MILKSDLGVSAVGDDSIMLKQLFSTIYPTDFGIFVSAADELVVA